MAELELKPHEIKANEVRDVTALEEKGLLVCPVCSEYFGRFVVVDTCSKCDIEFQNEQQVICCNCRHYCMDCFNEMKEQGKVEPQIPYEKH